MEPIYQEPNSQVYCGHALDILRQMPDESVDMVITSPPYWGLRTYKTEPIIWGDNHCEHEWGRELVKAQAHSAGETNPGKEGYSKDANAWSDKQGSFCLKCHAWKGELGLEPTIELYIEHLVLIFNEVKRVLKKTGTCWVNLDDSYASGKGTCFNPGGGLESLEGHAKMKDAGAYPLNRGNKSTLEEQGLLPKSLCLIPQRFAIAMVNAGWILRNDACWYKGNPMPESVKDRFTGSWEHLFFFTKSQRYFFEQQFEQYTEPLNRWGGDFTKPTDYSKDNNGVFAVQEREGRNRRPNELGRNKRDVWEINTEGFGLEMCALCEIIYDKSHFRALPEKPSKKCTCELGDVPIWEVIPLVGHRCGYCSTVYDKYQWSKLDGANTKICRCGESNWLSHFATFPEKLCETPILAGCSSMICKSCGKAREKIYSTDISFESGSGRSGRVPIGKWEGSPQEISGDYDIRMGPVPRHTEQGYTDCGCNAGFEPGVVLDPFCGSGKALAVAKKLGRKSIGIDLNPSYCKLAARALQAVPLAMPLLLVA